MDRQRAAEIVAEAFGAFDADWRGVTSYDAHLEEIEEAREMAIAALTESRYAALFAASAAVAEDYHDMAIVVDEDRSVSGALHPAVLWDACPHPKCAALREALSG